MNDLEPVVHHGRRWIRCPRCVGSGMVVWPTALNPLRPETKSNIERPCPDCGGKGEVEVP